MLDLAPYSLKVGHATDLDGGTGCTVIRGDSGPFRASFYLLGRATGTREVDALQPGHLVDRTDAILLTGGSAFGLDAAGGVMQWMEERGRGFAIGHGVVPIVPAAVIFDLQPIGSSRARPTPSMAMAAATDAASTISRFGTVGAGTGATVGKALGPTGAMKGGFGAAETVGGAPGAKDPLRVLAIAVVNAFGDVVAADGRILAGARLPDGTFADTERLLATGVQGSAAGGNTTLAVVAVNRSMARGELRELARAAASAMHRRLRPAASLVDGDMVFAIAPIPDTGSAGLPAADAGTVMAAGALACNALERAIESAVVEATGLGGVPGLADHPSAGAESPG